MASILDGRCRVAALAAAAVLAPTAALASPYETTDTDVASGVEVKGLWEAQSGRDQSESAPALDLTWALRPEVVEMSMTTGAAQIRFADGDHRRGLDDTELAVKWKLHGGEEGLSLAVEPTLVVPSGAADGIGDGAWRYAVPLIVQWQGGSMRYFANLGYSANIGGGGGEVSAGVVAERRITERLKIGVELAGEAPASDWSHGRIDANLGFKFKLAPQLELQGLVGRSLNGRDEGPATLTRMALEYAF